MAYDYAERLYDFRLNDFATFRRGFATLTELPISRSGVGGFFFPGRWGGGCWWALPGFGLIGGGCNIFSAFIMYSAEKCSFSDGYKRQ